MKRHAVGKIIAMIGHGRKVADLRVAREVSPDPMILRAAVGRMSCPIDGDDKMRFAINWRTDEAALLSVHMFTTATFRKLSYSDGVVLRIVVRRAGPKASR